MTHKLPTDTIPTDAAVGYVRDVLRQAEAPDDVVAALKLVGPLRGSGHRYGLSGTVGRVGQHTRPRPEGWWWEVHEDAYDQPTMYDQRAHGEGLPTRLAADRALCLALQALGWSPVEVPTEEEVAPQQETETEDLERRVLVFVEQWLGEPPNEERRAMVTALVRGEPVQEAVRRTAFEVHARLARQEGIRLPPLRWVTATGTVASRVPA